jgi:pimeloyl-ACP methyl ester carboxylesterase
MSKQRNQAWLIGVAAGAALAAAFTVIAQRQRRLRRALAAQTDELTQRAIADLGVPAESRLVQLSEVRLHTVVAGPADGPLVILLHGFPECWHSWHKQIPILAQAGYRVVAPDQRGYNLSDKPAGVESYQIDRLTADVRDLIHALGRERACIVAHDWGGAVAWRFAMDYAEMVERLVVMNAPHPVAFARELNRSWSQRRKSWYMAFFQLPWLPEALFTFAPLANARTSLERTTWRAGAFTERDLVMLASAWSQPRAMSSMINWYRAAFRWKPAARTRVIQSPTLLLWAQDDFALGLPLTYDLDRWMTDLTVHYIPNCGHWVQNEAPDEVKAQLLTFLSTTSDLQRI